MKTTGFEDKEIDTTQNCDTQNESDTNKKTEPDFRNDDWFEYGINHLDQFPELRAFIAEDHTPCPMDVDSCESCPRTDCSNRIDGRARIGRWVTSTCSLSRMTRSRRPTFMCGTARSSGTCTCVSPLRRQRRYRTEL